MVSLVVCAAGGGGRSTPRCPSSCSRVWVDKWPFRVFTGDIDLNMDPTGLHFAGDTIKEWLGTCVGVAGPGLLVFSFPPGPSPRPLPSPFHSGNPAPLPEGSAGSPVPRATQTLPMCPAPQTLGISGAGAWEGGLCSVGSGPGWRLHLQWLRLPFQVPVWDCSLQLTLCSVWVYVCVCVSIQGGKVDQGAWSWGMSYF